MIALLDDRNQVSILFGLHHLEIPEVVFITPIKTIAGDLGDEAAIQDISIPTIIITLFEIEVTLNNIALKLKKRDPLLICCFYHKCGAHKQRDHKLSMIIQVDSNLSI